VTFSTYKLKIDGMKKEHNKFLLKMVSMRSLG
jgi:hypothetical protein